MSAPDTTINSELDKILERYFHYKIGTKDRQDPLYQALKQWAAQEANKAELKGMETVNNCHGCVDNNEYLDERRAELVRLTTDKEQAEC